MPEFVVLLSVPGLRDQDIAAMPNLSRLTARGDRASLVPSFPCVTCPVQVNMTTGKHPRHHGVIANGFYWRDGLGTGSKQRDVEMWTAWNDVVEAPQIWDILHHHNSELTTAVWFPLLSKGCGANLICTPAPIHNPDGSESLWCYTQPTEMYGELRDALGHFPLKHFWGPLANIKSTDWIVDSAVWAARQHRPNFFYIYLPHLDYAAQKHGPDGPQAKAALTELDATLGRLFADFDDAYGVAEDIVNRPLFIVASEYVISPVDHVTYPNQVLREAGLLTVRDDADGEHIDFKNSRAWALVDHQLSHVFVKDRDEATIAQVKQLFAGRDGFDEVLSGVERLKYDLEHPRAGDVVLISRPNSWQAYYYWLDDTRAPQFARTVDIHRKPGYDPVELHFDMATKSIPLDATLIGGSHGAPAKDTNQRGVILTSEPGVLEGPPMMDTDVYELVLRQFGV